VQEVLQADWQDVWHSPQPLPAVAFNAGFAMVLMCFMAVLPHSSRCIGPAAFAAAAFAPVDPREPYGIL
jgi:hypothetical protein